MAASARQRASFPPAASNTASLATRLTPAANVPADTTNPNPRGTCPNSCAAKFATKIDPMNSVTAAPITPAPRMSHSPLL